MDELNTLTEQILKEFLLDVSFVSIIFSIKHLNLNSCKHKAVKIRYFMPFMGFFITLKPDCGKIIPYLCGNTIVATFLDFKDNITILILEELDLLNH